VFARIRWAAAGVAVGLGTSWWAQRKLKAVSDRYRPARLANGAMDKARTWPTEVRAALQEGKATMRQREAELRGELEHSPQP
jgi:hypothetical protein